MKDERYSVFLLSSEGTNLDGVRSIEYSYDWGLLPEGEYEMTFSLTMDENIMNLATLSTNKVAMIQVIGLNSYVSQASNKIWSGTNNSAQIIGLVKIGNAYHYTNSSNVAIGAVQLIEADNNPPIRIRSVPQGKLIVNFLQSDGTLASEATIDEYVLHLGFRRLF